MLVAAALNSLESRTIKVLLGDFIKPSSIVGYSNMRFFRFLAGWLVAAVALRRYGDVKTRKRK